MALQAARKWEIYPRIPPEAAFRELKISPLLAQILVNRGIRDESRAHKFLYPALSDLPDPFLMADMDKAAARIREAVRSGERITIFGDYDVDGTTATALLFNFLRSVGSAPDFYLPHRIEEGYGLNPEALQKIHAAGTKLIITADCGISSREEIRWARGHGMDVIVTDHHEIPETLPQATAIVNPKQKHCSYPHKDLAGVGVVFNLVIALRSMLRNEGFFQSKAPPNLKKDLDLVALGTLSDVVPLTGVNRLLAKYGLAELTRSARPGIKALKEAAGIGDSIMDAAAVNFRLTPRINAAGRMEESGQIIRLLTSEDGGEAVQIAARLNQLNSQRQQIEEQILADAARMMADEPENARSIVLASPDWHAGVIGIVASRLTEMHHRPTILIVWQGGEGKGSGRSIEGFSLYGALRDCHACLEKFGGHEHAGGLVIRRERMAEFSRLFESAVRARLPEDLVPVLPVDALVALDEVNESFLPDLEALSPFGPGNPEPVLGIGDAAVLESVPVGNGHLRLRLKAGDAVREAIAFRMGDRYPVSSTRMSIAFSPQINRYRGKSTLQLKVIDLQPFLPQTK